jgi:sugar O-acyltransferase (sialic acid O-acetyltransferase NeuD family)
MSDIATRVFAPLLSVNEQEAVVTEIFVKVGQQLKKGELLCTLETTKAAIDLESECEGFIEGIHIEKDKQVKTGDILFTICSQKPAVLSTPNTDVARVTPHEDEPKGILISDKGIQLARELGLPLNSLPTGVFLTEMQVREFAAKAPVSSNDRTPIVAEQIFVSKLKPTFDARTVLLYGSGGHATTIIDLVRQANHFTIAGIVAEPAPNSKDLLGVPILGGDDRLETLYHGGLRLLVNGVGAINHNRARLETYERLARIGFAFPTIVHTRAVIEPSAEVGDGVQIFGMAYVGSAAHIGFGAIVNTGAIISHHCKICSYAHIAPGAILAGNVEIGEGVLIGTGVTISVGVKIGAWARIGNGAHIHGDVARNGIVRSGATWPS